LGSLTEETLMPRLPALVAGMVESHGRPCEVTKIEDLSPRFRRVHLTGEGWRGHEWEPCQAAIFRVSPTEWRRYTPDAFDTEQGRMSLLFYRHSVDVEGPPSPGDAWLDGLAVGDRVTPMGLEALRGFRVRAVPGTVLICGDGTTVGLWDSLIRRLEGQARVRGVVEVPSPDVRMVRKLLPGIDVVAQNEHPGEVLLSRLVNAPTEPVGHAYLAGHGQTIQRARTIVRSQYGLPRSGISTQPYWATGRTGL
jgi:NADPH-dependent ferric siderophore reductase